MIAIPTEVARFFGFEEEEQPGADSVDVVLVDAATLRERMQNEARRIQVREEPKSMLMIVTYDVPIYIGGVRAEGLQADNEAYARDFAAEKWTMHGVSKKLEDALENTPFYVGDPYDDIDVSEDES